MAKMWYTVLKNEQEIASIGVVKAGTLFTAKKVGEYAVTLTELYGSHRTITISTTMARSLCTTPTLDANSAHEEAILLCEAAYC